MEEKARSYIRFRKPVVYNWRRKALVQLQCTLLCVAPYVCGHWFLMVPFYRWLHDRAAANETAVALGTIALTSGGFAAVCTFCIFYLLPFLNGNGWLRKCFVAQEGFVVQARFAPRLVPGIMGWAEDADDVGVLRIEDGRLVFAGDASEMEIHRDDIESVSFHNVGWRAGWLWGNEARLVFRQPIEGIAEVAAHTRQALTVPGARRFNREIEKSIREFMS